MNTIEKSRCDSGYFPILFTVSFSIKTDIFHCTGTVYYNDFETIFEVKRSPDYEIQLKVRAENLRRGKFWMVSGNAIEIGIR